MEKLTNKFPSVIPRSDIPVSRASHDADLEVRPFLAHRLLGSVLPASLVSLAWTEARAGKDVALRSHATPGLLIILEGRAILMGRLTRKVEAGDVITLPQDHEYGFTAVGPAGLHALHVTFDSDLATGTAGRASSLAQLLAQNEARLQTTLNNSFFSLLRRGAINTERKRAAMRESLRVFSDAFQTHLFTRQATCLDEEYATAFGEHLREELGQNRLLKVNGTPIIAKDAVLRGLSSWFCHQMLVLDNAEKAVVNLVLESGAYYVCTLSQPLFEGHEAQKFFDTHAEEDEHHKELSVALLQALHPRVYGRLHDVLETTWNMVDAMTQRLAYLIELDTTSS
jgi:mannose-6-phosphate isomerase-like protein (cupin superfamily)